MDEERLNLTPRRIACLYRRQETGQDGIGQAWAEKWQQWRVVTSSSIQFLEREGEREGSGGGYGAFPFLSSSFLMQQEPQQHLPGPPNAHPEPPCVVFRTSRNREVGELKSPLARFEAAVQSQIESCQGSGRISGPGLGGRGWRGAPTPNIDLREYVPSCSVRSALSRALAPETHLNAILLLLFLNRISLSDLSPCPQSTHAPPSSTRVVRVLGNKRVCPSDV
ncbi:uncharacterized protein CLUP02_16395 [Colletotrichum lupini]|uniref:Uncharacterized protein n=1 Tax=Colletotrichum lupini TaxID=145971 RepID=A0A9Q8WP59_9PEZI|nr:uncharacterized protein CLUP02_16395 [Colletotrichum lupini]UQC90863.1 hypothetical protein CLUP02_16395 [Colletotrichum lupini]